MKKRIISMMVVALMAVIVISTNVLASSGSGTVTVGYNSKMMQAKTDISNRVISDIYTIKEGTTYKVSIYEGYLDLKKFDLCFAGNNPNYNACISYTYNGN